MDTGWGGWTLDREDCNFVRMDTGWGGRTRDAEDGHLIGKIETL